MNSSQKPKIVDAHVHFYDHEQNRHDFLEHVDKMFEALIGNYSILPRQYFLDDYVADEPGLGLVVLVWQ